MHHRVRKRTQSADEEGGVGNVLVAFQASQLEDHPHHLMNGHHNGASASASSVHSPHRSRAGSVNSLTSVKSHRVSFQLTSHRRSRQFCMAILILLILLSFLILVGFSIFSIFHVALRGRPEWLYGNPVQMNDISTCLVKEDDPAPTQPPRVLWEWHNFTTSQRQPDPHLGPRLLIAQYSGFGEYAQFLNWISPVHQEYAKRHGYDYVILQGTLLDFEGIHQDCLSNLRATFDKIPLLAMAHSLKHKYDYVLVLDTDAMIINHDHDHKPWDELLPPNQLLAAQRVMRYDLSNTWDVNAGVTLWNLHHVDFEKLVRRWKRLSQFGTAGKNDPSKQELKQHLKTILTKNDDQYFLQTALLHTYSWWNRPVVAVVDEFNYYSGTLIKHFKRDKRSWSTSGLEQRLDRVKEAIRELCISQRKGISYCGYHEPEVDYAKRVQPEATTWL